jgi:hypothetical protein
MHVNHLKGRGQPPFASNSITSRIDTWLKSGSSNFHPSAHTTAPIPTLSSSLCVCYPFSHLFCLDLAETRRCGHCASFLFTREFAFCGNHVLGRLTPPPSGACAWAFAIVSPPTTFVFVAGSAASRSCTVFGSVLESLPRAPPPIGLFLLGSFEADLQLLTPWNRVLTLPRFEECQIRPNARWSSPTDCADHCNS